MGCAALVEVGVQGVFRAREVTLDKVLAAADDAFRIALVPPVLAPAISATAAAQSPALQ